MLARNERLYRIEIGVYTEAVSVQFNDTCIMDVMRIDGTSV
jgi:hypothetical protein